MAKSKGQRTKKFLALLLFNATSFLLQACHLGGGRPKWQSKPRGSRRVQAA